MNTIWNSLIDSLPNPHILQTWEWGAVKAKFGWNAHFFLWHEKSVKMYTLEELSAGLADQSPSPSPIAASLVLVRPIPIRGFSAKLSVAYIPKGPLLDWENISLRRRVLEDLRKFARRKGAIFLKIDPDVRIGVGMPGEAATHNNLIGHDLVKDLRQCRWRFSSDQIQYKNTVLIDLSPSEEEMLARMKQKTRYNIRYAGRKGVQVRSGSENDYDMLYRMYAKTSARDGFVIRNQGYYQTLWRTFMDAGMVEPLIAEVEREPVAAVVIFRFGGKAWYLHGMSTEKHRRIMPNYLLQWEAMCRSKAVGCVTYDMWGAPDRFDESDPMWGVYRFKDGFGGKVVRHIGAWDFPTRPRIYSLYTKILPRIRDILSFRSLSNVKSKINI